MVHNIKIIDILLVESSLGVIETFKEISRIFGLSILIADGIDEFVNLSTNHTFKFVLTNLHIEYNFSGLFVSRMYSGIRKIKVNDGKLFLYSLQNKDHLELAKMGLDDLSEEKYMSFFDFLEINFPENFFQYITSEEFRQSAMAIS